MPQAPAETHDRISLRLTSEEKALLTRAAALRHTSLSAFVIRHAVSAAQTVIDESESTKLAKRDSLLVLDLLDNPPAPNDKLMTAAIALPKRS